MKKAIGLVLILILIFTLAGCSLKTSNQKTEEELKAEIRTEMEAEAKLKAENAEIELEGMLVFEYGPFELGIDLAQKLDIDGKAINTIWFNNASDISKYLDRNIFVYTPDGIVIDESYNNSIPVKIVINKASIEYYDDLARTYAEIIKVLEIEKSTNLIDRSDEAYSVELYKSIFYDRIYMYKSTSEGTFFTKDIKDFDLYKTDEVFKMAVDKILYLGYFIQQAEGEYCINKEKQNYTDGEVFDEGNETFNLYEMKNGDKVSGLVIKNIDNKRSDDTASFDLVGTTMVIGEIMYDAEYYQAYILNVTDPYLFKSTINIEFPNNSIVNYRPSNLIFRNEEDFLKSLSQSDIDKFKEGHKLGVKIDIKDIHYAMKYGSEGGENCEFVQLVDSWWE